MHSAHAPPVLRCVGAQHALRSWAAQLCCKITHIQLFFSVSIIITVDNSPVAHVRRPSLPALPQASLIDVDAGFASPPQCVVLTTF